SNIVSGISPENKEQGILQISDIILDYISDREKQGKVVDMVEGKIKASEPDIKGNLLKFVSNKLDSILNSTALYDNIYLIINRLIDMVMNKPVSNILDNIDENMFENIANFIKSFLGNFVKVKLPNIVELLNIPKVVEDQINSYDVAFAEEIIIEIANKELKAITWLGALLGGIMGILSPLLQLLYK
ncbi:MAG TPA: DUF445 family protein, partial [Clostridiales bacterium]|nr:DUF445 family protein [Clostridiales bacterium]